MQHAGYDIQHYRAEFKQQVVDLLGDLWGGDVEENLNYFTWKYEDNPCCDSPLGIVALQGEEVAAFRGYFANRFECVGQNDNVIVLTPGDTCTHPRHQRKGLSVAMGKFAMKEYAPSYKLFLNMTGSKKSVPGYTKMGFYPLVKKAYVTHSGLLGLMKYSLTVNKEALLEASKIKFGQFGDMLVSDQARPKEMAELVAGEECDDGILQQYRDEGFFSWRFTNKKHKYAYYYSMNGDAVTGYVVVRVSPNNRRGYILDYATKNNHALREIIEYIVRSKHFDLVSIYSFSMDGPLSIITKNLGFKANGLVRTLEKKHSGEMPVLLRPVKAECTEKDYFIEGIDTRKIDSWNLKQICSDGA